MSLSNFIVCAARREARRDRVGHPARRATKPQQAHDKIPQAISDSGHQAFATQVDAGFKRRVVSAAVAAANVFGLAGIQGTIHSGAVMIHFVLHDPKDTVAVVVVEGVKAGQDLNGWIMDEDRNVSLKAQQDIPIGHKLALTDIRSGDTIIKYGIDIGKAVADIKAGAHAHVHNIKTKRW
jgi:(2R)-sulfolactate sulfo-lyase subunit alpha